MMDKGGHYNFDSKSKLTPISIARSKEIPIHIDGIPKT